METRTLDVSELKGRSKEDALCAKERLLRTFAFVPDGKLRWSPAPSARTALQIVAHCGMANFGFAAVLRGEAMEISSDPVEAAAQIRAAGRDVGAREEAIHLAEVSTAQVLAALDNVTAERLETMPLSPLGAFPFAFWMSLPSDHVNGHIAQIEYLQTVWGDLESH